MKKLLQNKNLVKCALSLGLIWSLSLPTLAETPAAPDIQMQAQTANEAEQDLDDALAEIQALMEEDISVGKTGSFGARLAELGLTDSDFLKTYVHGYTVSDAITNFNDEFIFDMHYFNVFVGANIKDTLIAEIQLEKEHGGDEQQVRFAQLDIVASPYSVIRVGKFLVPIGAFNTYLYPEYINKFGDRPFALREIVPVSWGDVGIQVFGKYDFGEDQNFNYALYAINGLHDNSTPDPDADPSPAGVRGMRNNHEDANMDKGLGGRLGVRLLKGLDLGLSAYTGATNAANGNRLSLFDLDASYRSGPLDLKAEYVLGLQGYDGNNSTTKQGFYVQGAYKVLNWLEPVARYDMINFSHDSAQNRQRVAVGVNFYPFEWWPKFLVKSAYSYTMQSGNTDPHGMIVQTAIGF